MLFTPYFLDTLASSCAPAVSDADCACTVSAFAARSLFYCHDKGAAAMTTHNAAVCIFVKPTSLASKTVKPAKAGGAACIALCNTAVATAAGVEVAVC